MNENALNALKELQLDRSTPVFMLILDALVFDSQHDGFARFLAWLQNDHQRHIAGLRNILIFRNNALVKFASPQPLCPTLKDFDALNLVGY